MQRASAQVMRTLGQDTITVLRALLDIFERYGVPRSIRTDNEAVFTSPLFRLFLRCFGKPPANSARLSLEERPYRAALRDAQADTVRVVFAR